MELRTLTDSGNWARFSQDKVTLLGTHLSHDHSLKVISELSIPLPMYPPPKAFNPKDVEYIIKRLSQKKAPGLHATLFFGKN